MYSAPHITSQRKPNLLKTCSSSHNQSVVEGRSLVGIDLDAEELPTESGRLIHAPAEFSGWPCAHMPDRTRCRPARYIADLFPPSVRVPACYLCGCSRGRRTDLIASWNREPSKMHLRLR